jgi:hypothetical protein
MSLRALKSFAVVLSLVACANEMQEIGAPDDNSGGSGSGASGGEASSGGTGSDSGGKGGTGSGSTGGTSSTGSGGKGGASGAFGGSAGVTGSGGSTGGNGGASGGNGGASGGSSGAGGSGGTGEPGTEDCSGATPWVASQGLTTPIPVGGEVSYMNKLFTFAGASPLNDFNAACPPEGSRAAWCDQGSNYMFELVGVCL